MKQNSNNNVLWNILQDYPDTEFNIYNNFFVCEFLGYFFAVFQYTWSITKEIKSSILRQYWGWQNKTFLYKYLRQ